MKKTMTFFCGLLIIVAALLACGSSSDTNTGTVTTPSSNNQAQTSSKHFKVGEAVKVGDTWEITVNSVKTSPGNDMSKPQKGQYLLLDVTAKNISNKEQDMSSLAMFKLTDDTGVSYTETVTTLGTPNPPDGKVEAGAPSRGTFTYDVPTNIKKFTFAFQADIVSGGQTIWDINI